MRIFVTGGAGFIGTYLCKKLSSIHKVTVYDNFSNSNKENFPISKNLTLIVGDILDNSKLLKTIPKNLIIQVCAEGMDFITLCKPKTSFDLWRHFISPEWCILGKNLRKQGGLKI